MDLRVRVMADVDGGMKTVDAARKYRVSTDWIRKLKRLRRQTGSFAARQQRVNHATKLDNDLPRLDHLVKERPDATLKELRAAQAVKRAPTVRSAGHQTVEGLWTLVGQLLDQFPADECRRYLRHSGYTMTLI